MYKSILSQKKRESTVLIYTNHSTLYPDLGVRLGSMGSSFDGKHPILLRGSKGFCVIGPEVVPRVRLEELLSDLFIARLDEPGEISSKLVPFAGILFGEFSLDERTLGS
jgi:hypothetical protein